MTHLAEQQVAITCPTCSTTQTATVAQIKAARALLGWSESTLAKKSRRAAGTVKRAEAGRLHADLLPSVSRSMQHALEAAGVEFIPDNGGGAGVRLRKPEE